MSHVEKEKKGAEQFGALSRYDTKNMDKASFVEGFVYGIIDHQFTIERTKKKQELGLKQFFKEIEELQIISNYKEFDKLKAKYIALYKQDSTKEVKK